MRHLGPVAKTHSFAVIGPTWLRRRFFVTFDPTLSERARAVEAQWRDRARAAIDEQTDADELEELQDSYDEARDQCDAARREIAGINDRLAGIADDITLPDAPEPPEAVIRGDRQPLIDSEWGFVEGTQRLKADKAYEAGEEGDDGNGDDGRAWVSYPRPAGRAVGLGKTTPCPHGGA